KREAGESPARSRHCKQRAGWHCWATVEFDQREGCRTAMSCKSGDLPWTWVAHPRFARERLVQNGQLRFSRSFAPPLSLLSFQKIREAWWHRQDRVHLST